MANVIYPKFKEYMLDMAMGAGGSASTPNVRAVLVDSADYTYNSAHDFLDDVAVGARVSVSANLSSKTFTNGIFDAADVTLTAVTGDQSEAIILYIHTGVDSTSRLIAYFDSGITNSPVTPNGGDIIINWDASGIFQL